ncbi:META domain-containing protein [Streptomyces sp. NPDC048577]
MLKTRTTTAIAALASLVVLSACGSERAGSAPGAGTVAPDVPVTGADWSFDTVTVAGEETRAPAGAHLDIARDGRASGDTGCNRFGARVTVEGNTLTVRQEQTTEKACTGGPAAFEDTLRKVFADPLGAELHGERLTLTSSDGGTVLALTAAPPAPLRGTTWTVDSLLSGDSAASLPRGSEGTAYFVIDEDGAVRGSLGCNRFSTQAEVSAGTISFGEITTTRMRCTGPEMQLETKLYEVFGDSAAYERNRSGLTLTAPGGGGFVAVAKPSPAAAS